MSKTGSTDDSPRVLRSLEPLAGERSVANLFRLAVLEMQSQLGLADDLALTELTLDLRVSWRAAEAAEPTCLRVAQTYLAVEA